MPKTNNRSLPDHKIRDCIEKKSPIWEVPEKKRQRQPNSCWLQSGWPAACQHALCSQYLHHCCLLHSCSWLWGRFTADWRLACPPTRSLTLSWSGEHVRSTEVGVKSTSTQRRCEQFMCRWAGEWSTETRPLSTQGYMDFCCVGPWRYVTDNREAESIDSRGLVHRRHETMKSGFINPRCSWNHFKKKEETANEDKPD